MTHAKAGLNGFYINLDRSPERRANMEAEFRKLGIDWIERFSAVDGRLLEIPPGCVLSAGGLACYLSHLQIIESTPADSFTLILEDDVELSLDLPVLLHEDFLAAVSGYDIVLLDCQPACDTVSADLLWSGVKRQLLRAEDLEDRDAARRLKGVEFHPAAGLFRWGLSSYIVTPRGRRNIPPIARECLDRGPPGQLDLLLVHALEDGNLSGCMTAPFLATPLLESFADPAVEGRVQEAAALRRTSAMRRLFFAGPLGGVHEFSNHPPPRPGEEAAVHRLLIALSAETMIADNHVVG